MARLVRRGGLIVRSGDESGSECVGSQSRLLVATVLALFAGLCWLACFVGVWERDLMDGELRFRGLFACVLPVHRSG